SRDWSSDVCSSDLVQELLGHRDMTATMIYTHVLNRGGLGVRSPADRLLATAVAGLPDLAAGRTVWLDSQNEGAGPMVVMPTSSGGADDHRATEAGGR